MPTIRTLKRACVLPLALGVVTATAGSASAHATITPSEAEAGSYAVLTVAVSHGCEGSPTTELAIQMPQEVLSVAPTRNALWEVEKVMEKLDEPITDAHGNEITERVGQVVYTADRPLPEGYRDAFELSLQIPDVPGETLAFPVVQSCVKGQNAWVETAAGGDAEELEFPAPTLTVLPPSNGGGHGADAEDSAAEDAAAETDQAQEESAELETVAATEDDGNLLGIVGLVAGLLGLAAGVTALVRVRRR